MDADVAMTALACLVLLPVFLLARLYPIWPKRHQGCDAYNILMNAEAFRARPRLPIVMPPLFMLEKPEQWYPPGFLVLCALIPPRLMERGYWALNHLIDYVTACLIVVVTISVGGHWSVGFLAALAYAFAAGPVLEFSALNVRPFGLALFNLFLLSAWLAFGEPGASPAAPLMAVAVLAVLLFYSHKLSIQQLWFTLPALTLAFQDWRWLAALAGLYGLAFLVWPRGAWRVLRGHAVIVAFWHRNWPRLGAHAVRQSPIYGDGHTRTDFYADDSLAGLRRHALDTLHQNYFVGPFLLAYVSGGLSPHGTGLFLLVWCLSTYGAGIAIHLLKPLRGIGLGRQYIKFALPPTLAGTAVSIGQGDPLVIGVAAAAALLALRQYVLVSRSMRATDAGSVARASKNLDAVLSYLATERDAERATGGNICVMTLPVHLADYVAYRLRTPVYWGTHSDVFDARLEAYFPVLREPLSHYAADGANRLLLDTRYASPEEVGLGAVPMRFQGGPYMVFDLRAVTLAETPLPDKVDHEH